jgi:probable phosphoglycerate mutase
MTVVLLVRHGLTDATGRRLTGWAPGVGLSRVGRDQARRAAERLADLPIRAIYSSPLERCVETAEPLARRLRLTVRRREALGEVRYGDWTGRSLARLSKTALWRQVQAVPSNVRFPNGESFLEVQQRAVGELRRIAAAHPRALVAVYSHADVIKLVVAHVAGIHQDLFQRLVIEPASVSAIAIGDGWPRIVKLNETGDLVAVVPAARPKRSTAKVRG